MVKIADIAKQMNLSEATVSNAFTGKGRMKPETKEAILTCAERMGYRSRTRKRSGNAKNIIIITETYGDPFVAPMITGVFHEANQLGLSLPVYSLEMTNDLQIPDSDVEELNQSVSRLLSRLEYKVSGILYLSQYTRKLDKLLDHLDIPSVCVFCHRDDGKPFVHYDERQGAYLAVDALLKEGRKRIAMISGPIDSIGMYLRSAGYQQALMEHHLPYDPRLVRIGDWGWESGYKQTLKLLEEGNEIDAIFAQNDFIGFGAARAIQERGLRVPEDISLIGFDGYLPGLLSYPELTTVRPPFEEMGRAALQRLLQILNGTVHSIAEENTLMPCSLLRRKSTRNDA